MSAPTPAPAPLSDLSPWVDAVRSAQSQRQSLHLQGGGSKSFYGEPVSSGLTTLDTRAWRGVVAYEPSELVVTVRSGTPLAELEQLLGAHGQCLPFEPPHFGATATVGGMVAAGLSGPARASVGAVRDFVLGAQMINGQGEALTFGGQVMKNVAGYDVSRLLAGSMGTLGLITEVSLKVLPVAPAEATLAFPLGQAAALAQLARWRGQPLPLNASCWVRDDTGPAPRETLYVRLRGAVAAVEAACVRMRQDTPGERMDSASAATDWAACREQTLPFFDPARAQPDAALWRLSVAATAAPLDLPGPCLIEWHGALRWVWAPVSAAAQVRALATQAGGHATLFRAPAHGPVRGAANGVARFAPLSGPLQTITTRLMAAFDPAGVFNPSRLGARP